MEISSMTIGERIKHLRENKGLERKELAELSGVSKRAIESWETGYREPKKEALAKLAEALDIDYTILSGEAPKSWMEETGAADKDFELIRSYHLLDVYDQELVDAFIKRLLKK